MIMNKKIKIELTLENLHDIEYALYNYYCKTSAEIKNGVECEVDFDYLNDIRKMAYKFHKIIENELEKAKN